MTGYQRQGMFMTLLGLGLLVAALFIHLALTYPRSSAKMTQSVGSALTMRRRIQSSLQRFNAQGDIHTLHIGQKANTFRGMTSRYATFVDIILRHGQVLLWGTGRAFWCYPNHRPDITFSVHPVAKGTPSTLASISKPRGIDEKFTLPRGTRWVGLTLPQYRVVIAYAKQGVWVWEQRDNHYTLK